MDLRADLPPVPERMRSLPRDRGFPVPFFVAWLDSEGRCVERPKSTEEAEERDLAPDFRIAQAEAPEKCWERSLCWICGETLGSYRAFVAGPMCAVNRVSSEPPSHRECAEFAATACPFLVRPQARRRENSLPSEVREAPGEPIKRNPEVCLVWITKRPGRREVEGGFLYTLGTPEEVLWYREGRKATRAEVMRSVTSGLPFLEEAAKDDGPQAVRQLHRQLASAKTLLPELAS